MKAKCRTIHALGFKIFFSSSLFGLAVNAELPNCDRHRPSLVPVKAAMFVIIPKSGLDANGKTLPESISFPASLVVLVTESTRIIQQKKKQT